MDHGIGGPDAVDRAGARVAELERVSEDLADQVLVLRNQVKRAKELQLGAEAQASALVRQLNHAKEAAGILLACASERVMQERADRERLEQRACAWAFEVGRSFEEAESYVGTLLERLATARREALLEAAQWVEEIADDIPDSPEDLETTAERAVRYAAKEIRSLASNSEQAPLRPNVGISHSIEEIREALQRIHKAATGRGGAYMRIPADERRDADLILAAAIDELEALRAAFYFGPRGGQ